MLSRLMCGQIKVVPLLFLPLLQAGQCGGGRSHLDKSSTSTMSANNHSNKVEEISTHTKASTSLGAAGKTNMVSINGAKTVLCEGNSNCVNIFDKDISEDNVHASDRFSLVVKNSNSNTFVLRKGCVYVTGSVHVKENGEILLNNGPIFLNDKPLSAKDPYVSIEGNAVCIKKPPLKSVTMIAGSNNSVIL